METLEASNILEKIISKGGLMGKCAQLYKTDPILTDQFIRECFEQCHTPIALQQWGEVLVSEIRTYTKRTAKK